MGNQSSTLIDSLVESTNFSHEEIERIRKRFLKIDANRSGTIDRQEFLSIPAVANNPLAMRLFAVVDKDGGGDVDFKEFIEALSTFSSKGSAESKLKFAFEIYDIDRDGYISNGELYLVLKMMVGSNLKDGQLQQIVDKTIMEADSTRQGKISFEDFKRVVKGTDVSGMTLEI